MGKTEMNVVKDETEVSVNGKETKRVSTKNDESVDFSTKSVIKAIAIDDKGFDDDNEFKYDESKGFKIRPRVPSHTKDQDSKTKEEKQKITNKVSSSVKEDREAEEVEQVMSKVKSILSKAQSNKTNDQSAEGVPPEPASSKEEKESITNWKKDDATTKNQENKKVEETIQMNKNKDEAEKLFMVKGPLDVP